MAPRARTVLWVCATTASLSLVAACQWVVALEAAPTAPANEGADAQPSAIPAIDPCGDVEIFRTDMPPGSSAIHDIDFALSFVTLEDPPPTAADPDLCPHVGFDLDRRTTCDGGKGSLDACGKSLLECAWGPTCLNDAAVKPCDGDRGKDNAAGALFRVLTTSVPNLDAELFDPNHSLERGFVNVLFHIGDYNGEADDGDVTASFFISSGLAGHAARVRDGAPPESDADVSDLWDRVSVAEWYVDPATVDPSDAVRSKYRARGQVRDYVLFLSGDKIAFPLGSATTVEIQDPLVMGKLVRRARDIGADPRRQDWEIVRGRLGGTLADSSVMAAIIAAQSRPDSDGGANCGGELEAVHAGVCAYADLTGKDNSTQSCRGLSIGVGFKAVPARFGLKRSPKREVYECDASMPSCD